MNILCCSLTQQGALSSEVPRQENWHRASFCLQHSCVQGAQKMLDRLPKFKHAALSHRASLGTVLLINGPESPKRAA